MCIRANVVIRGAVARSIDAPEAVRVCVCARKCLCACVRACMRVRVCEAWEAIKLIPAWEADKLIPMARKAPRWCGGLHFHQAEYLPLLSIQLSYCVCRTRCRHRHRLYNVYNVYTSNCIYKRCRHRHRLIDGWGRWRSCGDCGVLLVGLLGVGRVVVECVSLFLSLCLSVSLSPPLPLSLQACTIHAPSRAQRTHARARGQSCTERTRSERER